MDERGRGRVIRPGGPLGPRREPTGYGPGAAAARGYHFSHLNQLALEHLLGVRG